MQNPDLSLFRSASISRKYNIAHAGGDVYQVCQTPSDMSVLWGESFGSKERKFLREMLSQETIAFSLKETYQIHMRTLFQANANSGMNLRNGFRRKGLFALLLHDLHGELVTSWTWSKFIRPLYRKGFSILAADFPGFGKSSVGQVPSCNPTAWQGQEAHVVSKIMEEMSVAHCQILAVGHTCGVLFHMLQSAPHRMAGEHVLVNPVFDRNRLFEHVVRIEPPPGAKAGWQDDIKAKQQAALIDLLRTTKVRMWCMFDMTTKYRAFKDKEGKYISAPTKQLQKEWQDASDTYEMLFEASKNEFVAANLKVTEITKLDLCEAQAGKRIPVRMLVPSRHLKASVARFMSSYKKMPWEEMFQPNHLAHQLGLTRAAVHDKEQQDDSDDSDAESGVASGLGSHAQRALALMPQNAQNTIARMKSVKDFGGSDDPGKLERQQAEDRVLKAQEKAEKRVARAERGAMSASSSAPALPHFDETMTSKHSLCAHAIAAKSKLDSTGSGADGVRSSAATAQASKERKATNWASLPYEPDLSYGVRKMFLESFEASVETYKKETAKEFEQAEQANIRRGLRMMRKG